MTITVSVDRKAKVSVGEFGNKTMCHIFFEDGNNMLTIVGDKNTLLHIATEIPKAIAELEQKGDELEKAGFEA